VTGRCGSSRSRASRGWAASTPDGTPHIAPAWYRYEDCELRILTDRGTQKHRNIERDRA
jgi:nitroimidazol reductase NimA-like FMN-containing flavoprotein (pyridoxamine 5'-phosphate oxidase superfamily)